MSTDNSQPQQLTVKEALEQGYTHWGYDNSDFKRLGSVVEFTNYDFENAAKFMHRDCVLAQKNPYYLSVDANALQDIISEHITAQDNYHDDDYNTVPDALKEVEGWDEFATKINAKLKEHPYWYLTQIKLIP